MKELYKRLIGDIESYIMTTKELEQKYDLQLSQYDEGDHNYWSWRIEHRARSSEFWAKVSKDPNLTYNFIKLYKEFLCWDMIDYYKFYQDINFIHEFAEWIDWWKFSENFVKLNDENTIREFIDCIEIGTSTFNWNVSLDFVREFNEKIKWFDVDKNIVRATSALKKAKVCDEFANEIVDMGDKNVNLASRRHFFSSLKLGKKMFKRCIKPNTLSHLIFFDCLDEETLKDYVIPEQKDNKEVMELIFRNTTLSEQFVEKYIDIIDKFNLWKTVCANQELSEDFIEKYKGKVAWKNIVKYQTLSEDFIEKHLNYIKGFSSDLLQVMELSEQFIEKHMNVFKLVDLARYQTFSREFRDKYFNVNDYIYNLVKLKEEGY